MRGRCTRKHTDELISDSDVSIVAQSAGLSSSIIQSRARLLTKLFISLLPVIYLDVFNTTHMLTSTAACMA